MLHRMYLVPAGKYRPPAKKGRRRQDQHAEWIKLRTKHRDAGLRRNARTKEIADYMKQILPAATNPQTLSTDIEVPNFKAKSRRETQSDVTSASVSAPQIRPSQEIKCETPKREPVRQDNDDDDDDGFLEEDVKRFGRENVGSVASPYKMPYVYKRRFIDTQYRIRKDGGTFKIGDSLMLVDQDGAITIKENEFRGSEGLWELLTRKNLNKDDLRKYKKILLLTNAHLDGY